MQLVEVELLLIHAAKPKHRGKQLVDVHSVIGIVWTTQELEQVLAGSLMTMRLRSEHGTCGCIISPKRHMGRGSCLLKARRHLRRCSQRATPLIVSHQPDG